MGERGYDAAFAKFMGESIYRYACVKDSERVRKLEEEVKKLKEQIRNHRKAAWEAGGQNFEKCKDCNDVVMINRTEHAGLRDWIICYSCSDNGVFICGNHKMTCINNGHDIKEL